MYTGECSHTHCGSTTISFVFFTVLVAPFYYFAVSLKYIITLQVLVSRLTRAESSENLMKMLFGRHCMQSFVYRANKNGELTQSCGHRCSCPPSTVCVLDRDYQYSVSEKRAVPSYQCGADFHVVNMWLDCSVGRPVVYQKNTDVGLRLLQVSGG